MFGCMVCDRFYVYVLCVITSRVLYVQGRATVLCPHGILDDKFQNSPAYFTIEQTLQARGIRAVVF